MRFRLAPLAMALLSLSAHAEVQFGSPNYEVVESDGTARATVVLTNQDSQLGPVTVNYRTQTGSASSPEDYRTTSGTLVWEMGDNTAKDIEVPLTDDLAVEPLENFSVQLFSATGSVIGAIGAAQVRINDDDRPNAGEFQFAVTDLLVFEGQATATLQVRRVNGAAGAISVEVTRTGGGTASPGLDFSDLANVLTWADGDTSVKSFNITIIDDSSIESTETINYILQNPTGGATITRGAAAISIGDNDFEGAGEVRVFRPNLTVLEGDGTAQVTVGRFGGTNGPASVEYITQTGTAGTADFTQVRGSLNWNSGNSDLKVVTIPVKNDSLVEPDETFSLVLSNAIGAALGTPSSSTVTIVDDDVAGTSASLSSDAYQVVDNAGSVTIGVTRNGSVGTYSVTLTTADASAEAGKDYTSTTRVVSFADGESGTKNVQIPIFAPGATPEPDESFIVNLASPTGGSLGDPSSALVTIRSAGGSGSGTPTRLRFSQASYSVQDADGQLLIPVQRIDSASGAVSVSYATQAGTAQAGSDFTVSNGLLSWADGDTGTKTIVVPIVRTSSSPEGVESFSVRLSGATGASILSDVATVNIVPASTGSVLGFLDTEMVGVDRDGSLSFRVRRSGNLTGELRATVFTQDGSAIAGQDYTALSRELVWADGEGGVKVLLIPLAPPGTAAEQREFFTVNLSIDSGLGTLDPATARGTIKSYTAEVSAGVGGGGCSLGRGDAVTFGLMLLFSMGYLYRRRRSTVSLDPAA